MPRQAKADFRETVRIPLVVTANNRIFTQAGLGSLAATGIVGSGIVGSMIVGKLYTATDDQKFVNCFPEKIVNPLTGKEMYYITKRPGFETHTTPSSGNAGTAIRLWLGQGSGDKVISAFGSTNSTIYDGTSSIGTLTGCARDITETNATATATLVIPCENGNAYYYPTGGAMTQITDVDFPSTNIGTFVHMDGYAFIMTSAGDIYNSDLNSIANWTSTSFISAQASTDKGIGLVRYRNIVVAFGKETCEMFWNAGNPSGSPLSRLDQGSFKLGAISSRSICSLEDNIYWVSSTDSGSYAVYTMDGFSPKRISTPVIESQIAALGPSGNIDVSGFRLLGRTFIIVMVGGPSTFVYSVEDNIWHEWTGTRIWHKFTGNTATTNSIYSISRDSSSGKVYKILPTALVFTDDSSNYTMTLQTTKFDASNNKYKFLDKLDLVGDVQDAATAITLAWSDDDYGTWSDEYSLDLANADNFVTGLGAFRRRAFRLTNTSSTPVRLEALELEYRQGTH